MPVVNIGLHRTACRLVNVNTPAGITDAVDSIGFGTDDAAEAATNVRLGAGASPKNQSFWKTSTDVTKTTSPATITAADADPYWQFEATWGTAEANPVSSGVIFELGTASGSLTGSSPAGNDGTRLYTRKRVGGATGIGKTTDIELVGRVKVTY